MIEPIIEAFAILVEFARGLSASRRAEERSRISQVIDEVTSTVEDMVTGFDSASIGQRQLWQAQLRAMYEQVSILIPVPVHERYNERADMLVNMIAAARMYFWLCTFDGNRTLDGLTAEQVRDQLTRSGVTRSWAAAVQLVLTKRLEGLPSTSLAIQLAQERCIQMIATAKVRLLAYA